MTRKADLAELCTGRLPQELIEAIDRMPILVSDVREWQGSRPRAHVSVDDHNLLVEIRISVPLKRAIAASGAIAGTLWALAKVAIRYRPIWEGLLQRIDQVF